ncbi:MAG: 50S ribosomal protein L25/general stress protein Ctc [Gammaproteobacteria bacterium]|nr:50S ribosomal protein L25/general stress protein Ctc [Gammaproteobacteria bacterium]MDH3859984.1 50S ribosomal protein L25/general stress protein Ctc [Gammaproteobacteria bacterium]
MSDTIHLNAEPRSDSGKGASRRLRHQGMVPAIVYGGDSDPVKICIPHNKIFHELEHETIYTQVIELQVGDLTEEVILRDLQRHPYKNKVMHADFFRIDKNKPIKIVVPIHVLNSEDCAGVKTDGGMITQTVTEIEIIALPKDLPEYLEIDVKNLHLGDSLHLSDIKMPEGVELTAMMNVEETEHDVHDLGVVSVVKTREEVIEEEEPELAEGEEGEVAEGEVAEGETGTSEGEASDEG